MRNRRLAELEALLRKLEMREKVTGRFGHKKSPHARRLIEKIKERIQSLKTEGGQV